MTNCLATYGMEEAEATPVTDVASRNSNSMNGSCLEMSNEVKLPLGLERNSKSLIELVSRKDNFKSSKAKEKENGRGYEGHVENSNDNSHNGKPYNRKWKPNNKPKRPMKYFLFDDPHMDYLERSNLFPITKEDEMKPENEALKLGSIILNSEKVVGKLSFLVSKLTKKIKIVNSKEVPTMGVA
ncbi:hypothetical protein J1N35_044989 [Gossypium stocksii]|uniref:Uncharacterized protein n=1 Tax=Gossypium stocksii TaxID=47602 RepID=A0A9D3UAJ5_9ROSI|nr:hypothetical protein J1N35_044989 [Gossypium stocksii]